MGDVSELDLRLATAIDLANIDSQLLPDPNIVLDPDVTVVGDSSWYGQPQQQFKFVQVHPEQPQETPSAMTESVARQRRQRARVRKESISALLPDEVPLEPPHHPDETVPIPFARPCSMARPNVPPTWRCVVMLNTDYKYRMCEGCRMRFKLMELRANGIRYDDKKKARATPRESRKQKHKAGISNL